MAFAFFICHKHVFYLLSKYEKVVRLRSIGLLQGKNNRIKRNKSGRIYCRLVLYPPFRFYLRNHIKQQF